MQICAALGEFLATIQTDTSSGSPAAPGKPLGPFLPTNQLASSVSTNAAAD